MELYRQTTVLGCTRVAPLVNWLQLPLLQFWAALLPAARQKRAERMPDFYGLCWNSSTQHGSLSISTRTVSFLSLVKYTPHLPFKPSFSSGFPFPFLLTSHFLTFLPFISSHHQLYRPSYTSQFTTCFSFTTVCYLQKTKVFLFSCLCLGLFLNYYTLG